MAKLLDSDTAIYEPNRRSTVWLKLKQDYITDAGGEASEGQSSKLVGGGIGDTLDLVVIGAWHGSGRKKAWWSPFLLACYNPEDQTFQTVCKCMSGFSDEFYKSQNAFYEQADEDEGPRRVARKPFEYDVQSFQPVWFRPMQVWEIRGAELTVSPTHTAAQGLVPGTEQGLSLRFPRFVRVREDKRPEDATTCEQLVDLYMAQTRR
mmetsp:Transcript_25626/g.72557  ORF Transcript_25626/g.72557 Transcript_25626/m.72557 type:complete len:206 (-) Transcript_25626:104-721(-)